MWKSLERFQRTGNSHEVRVYEREKASDPFFFSFSNDYNGRSVLFNSAYFHDLYKFHIDEELEYGEVSE